MGEIVVSREPLMLLLYRSHTYLKAYTLKIGTSYMHFRNFGTENLMLTYGGWHDC